MIRLNLRQKHGTGGLTMADFTILSKPVAICFECPFCESEVEIPWSKIEVPDSWCEDWGDIGCPYCGKMVSLGEWTYD